MKALLTAIFITLMLVTHSIQAKPDTMRNAITEQKAIQIAQQSYPGRVLSVKRTGNIFNVKTLSSKGEVRIIKIDANTGKVLNGY